MPNGGKEGLLPIIAHPVRITQPLRLGKSTALLSVAGVRASIAPFALF